MVRRINFIVQTNKWSALAWLVYILGVSDWKFYTIDVIDQKILEGAQLPQHHAELASFNSGT